MRIAPRAIRFAIFSCRALTASAAEAASADNSSGPPVVARNPAWLRSTKIEIVMANSSARGRGLASLYSISQVMGSESTRALLGVRVELASTSKLGFHVVCNFGGQAR